MVGQLITDEKGQPLPQYTKLSPSSYQPSGEVKTLFQRCQHDYGVAWRLQHRPFDEFDGLSLLQRTKRDQETFGAYVGVQWVAEHKKWRWKGRKNTARNKLIGILAHILGGMLYPLVHAQNEEDEEDKVTARVMRIIVEEHLRKAGYEMKFLYMTLSALVNPAVIVRIDYVEAWQRIKERLADGKIKITEAIDEFLTGLQLNLRPVDQVLIADFYTPVFQLQPHVIDIERISWDMARKIYGQNPNFKYVEKGKTRIVLAGQENQTLYDIDWTEADIDFVQKLTFRYRDEDLEAVFVGGVFMGNEDDVYNSNPFKHRRLSLVGDRWVSIPIYQYAKGMFEPIDPTGRFFYGKSGAFKEYWDDATQNKMHQLLIDGTYLDVIKPSFITGLAKVDSTVMVPGAVIGMPPGGSVTQYSLGSNLPAAMQALQKQEQDMSESTQDKIMQGTVQQGITATQSIQAQNQARIFLGVFGLMIADLIKQVGELVMDCVIQHTLQSELDATIPGTLRLKQKILLAKSKEGGKDMTNKIVFTDKFMGKGMSQEEKDKYEWKLWDDANGIKRDKEENMIGNPSIQDQIIWHINPFKFARMKYSMFVDADQITNAAMGNDRLQKLGNFQILTDPRIAPFTDQKAVAEEVIEEFSVGDPDRFKAKANVNQMMQGVMGQGGQPQVLPAPQNPLQPARSAQGTLNAATL